MRMDFEDFCARVFVVADDIMQQIKALFKRPGPKLACKDSKLIAMSLIGECRGWHISTELLRCWPEFRYLYPHAASRSCLNRRRRNLMHAINLIRQVILRSLDLSLDRQC